MQRENDRWIGAAAAVMQSLCLSVMVKRELSRKAKCPGRGKSGCHCSGSCPRDPAPDKWKKMDGWMDGWMDGSSVTVSRSSPQPLRVHLVQWRSSELSSSDTEKYKQKESLSQTIKGSIQSTRSGMELMCVVSPHPQTE